MRYKRIVVELPTGQPLPAAVAQAMVRQMFRYPLVLVAFYGFPEDL